MMDFQPSHRLLSRLVPKPDLDASAAALPIPVFVVLKRRRRLRQHPRCSFRGFYEPEAAGAVNQIWTRDQAVIECQFAGPTKLRYVWLEIGATSPRGSKLDLLINDEPVAQNWSVRRRGTLCARLPEPHLVTCLSVRLRSTTFIPGQELTGSEDARELGVGLRAVVFAKRRSKYRAGSYRPDSLANRLLKQVREWLGLKAA